MTSVYAAHWWHPTVYEAMMVGGSAAGQVWPVREVDAAYHREVLSRIPRCRSPRSSRTPSAISARR